MEWFSEVIDLHEPVSVNTSGVSNQMSAKLAAYGLGDGALQIIYSYLKNRKQSEKRY